MPFSIFRFIFISMRAIMMSDVQLEHFASQMEKYALINYFMTPRTIFKMYEAGELIVIMIKPKLKKCISLNLKKS